MSFDKRVGYYGSPHQFHYPQSRDIHIVAMVPSALTLTAALLGSYWFISMQRNFRTTLVLILVLADAFKSLWIFIFSVAGLVVKDKIETRSVFCQVGGFFLQLSFEACDLAILLLTLHVTLQILAPRCLPHSSDGLYIWRHWVIGACIVLPVVDALVPFSRLPANPAYTYDGAYCSLFLQPLAYTLCLSWIPRYTIWLTIFVAITSVYVYSQSQAFERRGSTASQIANRVAARTASTRSLVWSRLCCGPRADKRQQIDEQDEAVQLPGAILPLHSGHRARPNVRKLILYPVIYMIAWSVPFTTQIVSYSTSKDVNNVYGLRAGSVFCVSLLGFFDVIIFCMRERPWRYSSRGNGTFAGSFCLPSRLTSRRPSAVPSAQSEDASGGAAMTPPARPIRTYNKGTDSHRRLAQHAYERLAIERAQAAVRPAMRRSANSTNLQSLMLASESGGVFSRLEHDDDDVTTSRDSSIAVAEV